MHAVNQSAASNCIQRKERGREREGEERRKEIEVEGKKRGRRGYSSSW